MSECVAVTIYSVPTVFGSTTDLNVLLLHIACDAYTVHVYNYIVSLPNVTAKVDPSRPHVAFCTIVWMYYNEKSC